MTFQIYHKKLGRVASHPSAYIIDQEPYTFRDYTKQVHRWFLGFWQTFFYHGYWPSFFWFATFLFTLEMVLYSFILLALPALIIFLLLTGQSNVPMFHFILLPFEVGAFRVTLAELVATALFTDYALTMLTAWIEAKPILMVYGLGFFFLRYVDTIIFLYTLLEALFVKSATGQWQHPARKKFS